MKQCLPVREDFPVLVHHKDISYLDSAASAQKSKSVIDAVSHFSSTSYANIHRGLYPLSVEATKKIEDTREMVRDFISAKDSSEIIFTKGTTEGLNLLATSLPSLLESRNNKRDILVSAMEHHANLIPWQQLCERHSDFSLGIIPLTQDLDLDYVAFESLLKEGTVSLVSVTQLSNVLGTVVDISRVYLLCQKYDVLLVVDAAQSIAHMKVDVAFCDFMVFSSHKLGGPSGVGVLYGRKDLLNKMQPYQYGGDMVKQVSFTHAQFLEVPARLEAGTLPLEGVVGLGEAISYLQNIGMESVLKYEEELFDYALQKLQSVKGVTLYHGRRENGDFFKTGILSFDLKGIHPHDVAELCASKGVCIRAGHHCAMPLLELLGVGALARMSIFVYTRKEDVDLFIEALQYCKEVFKV